MRLPAAFLFIILLCSLWAACDNNEDDIVCCFPARTVDCSTINTYDSTLCTLVSNVDSVTYVKTYLGTWYLTAQQDSGFGSGSSDCLNYIEIESPIRFTLSDDYTWRYVSEFPAVDTTLSWSAVSGITGWFLMSSDLNFPIPQPRFRCDEYLVRDDRPVDGALSVFAKAE